MPVRYKKVCQRNTEATRMGTGMKTSLRIFNATSTALIGRKDIIILKRIGGDDLEKVSRL